jgi:hypothetical protein
MHDREREPSGRDRTEPRETRCDEMREYEREHGRDEQLPARSGRQRQEGVGAALSRRQPDQRGLSQDEREGDRARAEQRHAGLVDERERERRQHARLVQRDHGRIDAGQLRHECEEGVPERERVAGMQAAVAELADPLERELVEGP